MEFNFLQKSILATVAYYDILDYPLTDFEVYKYLINPLHVISLTEGARDLQLEPFGEVTLLDVLNCLASSQIREFVSEKNGFYFLKGRQKLYEQRIERQKIAAFRWKKVYKVLRILQVCPFVKMVAVCNSLAIDNSKEEADIDFFIIIRKNRIWLTRLWVTFLTLIMGEWRHKKRIVNKICLSFYITDEALNLKQIAIRPHDIYLVNWIAQLKPIYCENQIYRDFIFKNLWVKSYLINFGKIFNHYHPEFKKNKFLSFVKIFSEKILGSRFGNLAEKLLRFVQKRRIARKMIQHEIPTAVVVSDKMLKFHENDKRDFFQKKFSENIKELLAIDQI